MRSSRGNTIDFSPARLRNSGPRVSFAGEVSFARQFNEPGRHGTSRNDKFRHRDRQFESSRARTSRIHEYNAVAMLDDRLVRVAGDDDLDSGGNWIYVEFRK